MQFVSRFCRPDAGASPFRSDDTGELLAAARPSIGQRIFLDPESANPVIAREGDLNMIRSMMFFGGAFLTGSLLWAQMDTATLTGIVQDSQGGSIVGAKVEVANTETGVAVHLSTNDRGYYTAPQLRAGVYSVRVAMSGFRTAFRERIVLNVQQAARIDFVLEVGDVNEQVTISAEAPLLESEAASLGQVIENRAVAELPLNGRNYLDLAKLSTGVVEASRGDRGAVGGSFSANGVRAPLNNFILDGIDNNSRVLDFQSNSPVAAQPSVDAIQEFKVQTHSFSAEFGQSAGAVVNVSVKSGTNDIHGSLFEFLRNDSLDARNFFSDPATKQPKLARNQFGGTVGGPIRKSRTFYFGSWERTIERRGVTFLETVPDPARKSGDFTAGLPIFDPDSLRRVGNLNVRDPFPGNRIPSNRFDPVAAGILGLMPNPTSPQAANNFLRNPVQTTDLDRIDGRVDHNFSERHRLFGRYSFSDLNLYNPPPFDLPLVGAVGFSGGREVAPRLDRSQNAAIGYTYVIAPSLLSELRLGYNRIKSDISSFVPEPLFEQYGFKGIPPEVGGLPTMSVAGYTPFGEGGSRPNFKISETYQINEQLMWFHGSHTVKAGMNYRGVRSHYRITQQARGSFTFNGVFSQDPQNRSRTGDSFADFILGVPSNANLSNVFNGDMLYPYLAFYLQDDWKLTSRLTLNLGIRYDYYGPMYERRNGLGNLLTNEARIIFPAGPVPPGLPASLVRELPEGVHSRGLVTPDRNNLAPRFGIAWQATPRTVIRAGGGLFFADHTLVGAGPSMAGSPPFGRNAQYPTDQLNPLIRLATGFPPNALDVVLVNLPTSAFRNSPLNFPQTHAFHWSFDIQRELRGMLVSAGYSGTKGTQLITQYDINQPRAGAGAVAARRPLSSLGGITTNHPMGNSTYHSLQAKVERRFSAGFSLLTSYTFSRALDWGGEPLLGEDRILRDAQNVALERGLALFDMRHRLVGSTLWELPVGSRRKWDLGSPAANAVLGNWQINAITTVRAGTPFTPTLGFSTANTGHARPSRFSDGNLDGNLRSVSRWFDTSAFGAAPQFQFGNSGRNVLIGPGAFNVDLSVFKVFALPFLGERGSLQVRFEAFNAFNTPQFGIPNPRVDLPQGGSITDLATPMREMQMGLRIVF